MGIVLDDADVPGAVIDHRLRGGLANEEIPQSQKKKEGCLPLLREVLCGFDGAAY